MGVEAGAMMNSSNDTLDLSSALERVELELERHTIKLPAVFNFRFQNQTVDGRLEASGRSESIAVLTLSIHLGTLPYSAENKFLRAEIKDAVAVQDGSQTGTLAIGDGNAVSFDITDVVSLPMTHDTLLTALTVNLLKAGNQVDKLPRWFASAEPTKKLYSAERRLIK